MLAICHSRAKAVSFNNWPCENHHQTFHLTSVWHLPSFLYADGFLWLLCAYAHAGMSLCQHACPRWRQCQHLQHVNGTSLSFSVTIRFFFCSSGTKPNWRTWDTVVRVYTYVCVWERNKGKERAAYRVNCGALNVFKCLRGVRWWIGMQGSHKKRTVERVHACVCLC